MASLTLSIGNFSSSITGNDARVGEIVRNYAVSAGAPADSTYQEFLDFAVQSLVTYVQNSARMHYVRAAAGEAQLEADSSLSF
jgi:hypothetical protein